MSSFSKSQVLRRFPHLVLLATLAVHAHAGIDEGIRAIDRADFATAHKELEPLADQGNVEAQWRLGQLIARGQGVNKDPVKAAAWYRRAAEKNYAPAQNSLGYAYLYGLGMPQGTRNALIWLRKAAEQGNDRAMRNFATIYDSMEFGNAPHDRTLSCALLLAAGGGSVREGEMLASSLAPQNVEMARKLADDFRKPGKFLVTLDAYLEKRSAQSRQIIQAAQTADSASAAKFGRMYFDGSLMAPDTTEAWKWINAAAEEGLSEAQWRIGTRFKEGSGVKKSPQDAVAWFQRAAQQGHAQAQVDLAYAYLNGDGVSKDIHLAYQWFRKAAAQGNANAFNALAFLFTGRFYGYEQDGRRAVPRDYVMATALYALTDQSGSSDAMDAASNLKPEEQSKAKELSAALGERGRFLDVLDKYLQDRAAPVRELTAQADRGDVVAQSKLGHIYLAGTLIAVNRHEGIKWIEAAATKGDAKAQYTLANELCEPMNISAARMKDPQFQERCKEAFNWYLKAAQQNDVEARLRLAVAYEKGVGVPQSGPDASLWYRKAIESGDRYATHALFNLLISEDKSVRDLVEARKWLDRIIERGNPDDNKNFSRYFVFELSRQLSDAGIRVLVTALRGNANAQQMADEVWRRFKDLSREGSKLDFAIQDMLQSGQGQTFGVAVDNATPPWEFGMALYPDLTVRFLVRQSEGGTYKIALAADFDAKGEGRILPDPKTVNLRDFGIKSPADRFSRYPKPIDKEQR